MAIRSRRKAREAALKVLYEAEISHVSPSAAMSITLAEAELAPELVEFATILIEGVRDHGAEIDQRLADLVLEYAFERVAAVDRNVMRIAAFELLYMPAIPPAVTLNEAIDIAKKYSTIESGKFVNGVLGRLLIDTPKANWDPATAPKEIEERAEPEPPIEVEEVEVDEQQARKLAKVGGWTLRSGEPK